MPNSMGSLIFEQLGFVAHCLQTFYHLLGLQTFGFYGQYAVGMGEVNFPVFEAFEVIEFGTNGIDAARAFDGRFKTKCVHGRKLVDFAVIE